MKFIQKHIELIFLSVVFLSLVLKHKMIRVGEGMTIISMAMFAMFYLLSAIFVFLDRQRIEKVMRITYFAGLWSMAFGICGIMARIFLWDKNEELLVIAASASSGILIFFYLTASGLITEELKLSYRQEMMPLIMRVALNLLVVLLMFVTSYSTIYNFFGAHRDDPKYVDLLLKKMDKPDDEETVEAFRIYHESISNKHKNDD